MVSSLVEMKRRDFLQRSSFALAALAGLPALGAETNTAAGFPRAVFTKGLEALPFDELGEKLAAIGVRLIEAPIRANGHLKPQEVADKLPAFVEALRKHQIEVQIMTTDINKVDKPGQAEATLRAAVTLGIKRYRLAHLHYTRDQPLPRQLENLRAQLKDLAALNAQLGIQGHYQNHRGSDYVGAPIWDMVGLLEEIDPAHLGLAFDFAHATVEGTNTWELNFRRAAPHVVAVYFKDYKIANRTSSAAPLGEGALDPKAAALVRELLAPTTPISLHVEHTDKDPAKVLAGIAKDLATLNGWFA
jgi:sugar phosphate isomerase/epimerase